jgi:hypothetical protein
MTNWLTFVLTIYLIELFFVFIFLKTYLKTSPTKRMSEFFFCIFCDSVVLSLDSLREHLSQHLSEEGNDCQISLSQIETEFVDNFVEYEQQLSASLALMPKELPKDNVKTLLMGCPACDSLIKCYDLIPNRESKYVCHCGQQSKDMPLFECIQCHSHNHLECSLRPGLKSIDFL